MIFTLFAVLVVLLAVAGFLFQKLGEFAGIGEGLRRGSLRAPHGRLVRTKRLDSFEDVPFLQKLPRALLPCVAVTVVLGGLSLAGVTDLAGAGPLGVDLIVVVVLAVGLVQRDAGILRPLGYAIVGYLAPAIVATLIVWYGVGAAVPVSAAVANGVSMVFGTLGAACAVSAIPVVRTYAREFEDGYVNALQVASTAAVTRRFEQLADDTWKPPADRVENAAAAYDLRAYMEQRDR